MKDKASKHWLCEQIVDRHGTLILSVDRGHFNDIVVDVASTSLSCALLRTEILVQCCEGTGTWNMTHFRSGLGPLRLISI